MRNYKKEVEKSITKGETANSDIPIRGILDELAVKSFARVLVKILEEEIKEYIGRERYEHVEDETIYRNGYSKERKITIGSGTAKIRAPRLREPYESRILKKYQTRSEQVTEMILDLYVHGLSTGDYSRFLDKMLGEEASLSSSTIIRMKQDWKKEYEEWRQRRLDTEYLYLWVDGVYPKAGPKDEKMAILVAIGIRKNGEKDVLLLEEGYRESYESWKDVFKNLKERGVEFIGLVIGDGIKGLWKAVTEIYPKSEQQRCWVHKMMNILDKVPTKVQDEILDDLREIYNAVNKQKAESLIEEFKKKYYSKYPNAVLSLEEAEDKLLTYYKFPKWHWKSIKTTNPIESCFATVKLRTNAARRIRTRESAVYLIFKIMTESQKRWRKINKYRLVSTTIEVLKNQKNIKVKKIAA